MKFKNEVFLKKILSVHLRTMLQLYICGKSKLNTFKMTNLLKIIIIFYTLVVIICSISSHFISFKKKAYLTPNISVFKKEKKKFRKNKKPFFLKRMVARGEDNLAIFIVGMAFSVASIVLLLIGGGGAILFGFFGALFCFLAWNKEDGVHLPLVGVGLGLIGFIFEVRQFFNTRD